MTVKKEWLIEGDFTIASGRECMDELLVQHDLPTAVLGVNDVVAVGALSSTARHGITIPCDMALTGFDGINLAENVAPSITTVAADFKKMIGKIMDIVQTSNNAGMVSETTFDLELIVRESTVSTPNDTAKGT